jgi:hypothetical protein
MRGSCPAGPDPGIPGLPKKMRAEARTPFATLEGRAAYCPATFLAKFATFSVPTPVAWSYPATPL